MMTLGLRLSVMFGLGFVTWLLVFLRSYALDARHTRWLCFIVLCDEFMGIGTGMYLARSGTWLEAGAVAAGGALAAALVMWRRNR